jgi:hypothetical protein
MNVPPTDPHLSQTARLSIYAAVPQSSAGVSILVIKTGQVVYASLGGHADR